MENFDFARRLILAVWKFFAQHFWADLETLWRSEHRTRYWYVGWIINALLTYSAFLVTKGFANQVWFGFRPLALLFATNVAAAICTFAYYHKQYKLIIFAGHWGWVVWTSSTITLLVWSVSLFIK